MIMDENQKTKYNPISCSYYDELEAFATKKERCNIIYLSRGREAKIRDVIVDFQIINEAEHMILTSGTKIRLDTLVSVNDKRLDDNKYC